ncbi:MAG TPA: M48 family metalloprotease [Trebonia sp.]|nr:M48 family metalloprotease [Trebonia sp.]
MGFRWLRTAALAAFMCSLALIAGYAIAGPLGVGAAWSIVLVSASLVFLFTERAVLTAVRARPVGEVEHPELYQLVRDLSTAARLPMPRLFISPAVQPNALAVGQSARSVSLCLTEGLLRSLSPAELRAVLAHELAHVARGDIAGSSWCAGFAALLSLIRLRPVAALVLRWGAPTSREYGADACGALLTGDPMALASALRKIDVCAASLPLPPSGGLAASGHLMIAHPFPDEGYGRLFLTHPPVGERVRRLEALAGYPR